MPKTRYDLDVSDGTPITYETNHTTLNITHHTMKNSTSRILIQNIYSRRTHQNGHIGQVLIQVHYLGSGDSRNVKGDKQYKQYKMYLGKIYY